MLHVMAIITSPHHMGEVFVTRKLPSNFIISKLKDRDGRAAFLHKLQCK